MPFRLRCLGDFIIIFVVDNSPSMFEAGVPDNLMEKHARTLNTDGFVYGRLDVGWIDRYIC